MRTFSTPDSLFTKELERHIEHELSNEYVSAIYKNLEIEYKKIYELYQIYKTNLENNRNDKKSRDVYRECVICILRILNAYETFFDEGSTMKKRNELVDLAEPTEIVFQQKVIDRILKIKNCNEIYFAYTHLRDSYKKARDIYFTWIDQAKSENKLDDPYYETLLSQSREKMKTIKEAYKCLFQRFIEREHLL